MLRQDLIRAKAAALNLSILDIAEQAELAPNTVRGVLKDPTYNVTLVTLEKVTKLLGLKLVDVLDENLTVEAMIC